MQTTLARRQRHRRVANRRPKRRGSPLRRILIAIPIILVLVAVLTAGAGVLFTAAAYNYYAQGLPDPEAALTNLKFDQQTIVYDRTGKVELARLGNLKREEVAFAQIPGETLDATTAIEDKDFWVNAGFDPLGIISAGLDTISGRPRGASTITQQLVRNRLLPAELQQGDTYERKVREIIQSIRLTEAYPGATGKQQIITAYLNNNFYGNQTYGVKAAAKGYFGKTLDQLTLAEHAILAAIPQSPTKFDLVRNAEEVCADPVDPATDPPPTDPLASDPPASDPPPTAPPASDPPTTTDPAASDPPVDEVAEPSDLADCKQIQLQVPVGSEIVVRRNYILDLMKTRSTLTGNDHSIAEYEAAKLDPVVIREQVSPIWRAPQFVWQVREALTEIICPETPLDCDEVDSGGYRVTTTLNWDMQKITEKWVYVAARAPQAKDPRALLKAKKIPTSEWGWILNLKGRNIHNAAAAVIDYRTGQVFAYVGSASYTAKGNKKFQPQFDVLADGWRQPGSAIKPIDYAIGIEDETLTASTMFMDVVTDFGKGFTPTQADKLERGPVRLRSALQFSLNVPAIKGAIIQGLDHTFDRSKDFGLIYPSTATPVLSMGIGTLETHPIDMISAYGTIANGGVRMPRQTITRVVDEDGRQVWPIDDAKPEGIEVMSPQAAYIVTDILAGNTQAKVNPFWAEFAIYRDGKRRPAAYKTGTTSDNRDVHAYGYLAPPKNQDRPGLVAGVWMGNSDNQPNKGSLSLDSSAPLWSAILSEVSQDYGISQFVAPGGLETATVDAFTGLKPGPFTSKKVKELFLPGTVPTERETIRVSLEIDEASGKLWREGCVGPRVSKGFFDLSEVESNFPAWQKANRGWAARAAKGPGTRGGPEKTRTSYFYNNGFAPYGRSWGAPFAPREKCPLAPPPCGIQPPDPEPSDALPAPTPIPCPSAEPTPFGSGGNGNGNRTPRPTKRP